MNWSRALYAFALASYLWLCFCWFDHDLGGELADTPVMIPLGVLAVVLTSIAWFHRGRLRLGTEGKIALAVFSSALATRLPFLASSYGLFSSDAAAQGIMALHIGEGKHHPIFLYKWSYVGSLKAHVTALLASMLGDPVVSFALSAVLVYAAFAAAVYFLARSVTSRTESVVASLLVIVAPGFLTAWGMGNEGSYVDVMFFGTLMLGLVARLLRDDERSVTTAFWIGLLGGLAFWIHILATYYLLACAGVLAVHRFGRLSLTRLGAFASGFAVGDFPGLLWNATNDWLSFRWWMLDAENLETGARLGRFAHQLGEVFVTSFPVLAGYWPADDPPGTNAAWRIALALLIPLSFASFGARHRHKLTRTTPEATLLAFAVLVVLVFAMSSFGWMTAEPRYLLFVFSVVPIFVATLLATLFRWARPLAVVVAIVLLVINLRGSLSYWKQARASDPVNREYLRQLEELGIRYVHSDYHLSYKYVFLSHGRMVWTSALGPSKTEWYEPFREEVEAASSFALVPRSFRFAERIERRLEARAIRYRREDLLYPLLFDFSEPITLEELR